MFACWQLWCSFGGISGKKHIIFCFKYIYFINMIQNFWILEWCKIFDSFVLYFTFLVFCVRMTLLCSSWLVSLVQFWGISGNQHNIFNLKHIYFYKHESEFLNKKLGQIGNPEIDDYSGYLNINVLIFLWILNNT